MLSTCFVDRRVPRHFTENNPSSVVSRTFPKDISKNPLSGKIGNKMKLSTYLTYVISLSVAFPGRAPSFSQVPGQNQFILSYSRNYPTLTDFQGLKVTAMAYAPAQQQILFNRKGSPIFKFKVLLDPHSNQPFVWVTYPNDDDVEMLSLDDFRVRVDRAAVKKDGKLLQKAKAPLFNHPNSGNCQFECVPGDQVEVIVSCPSRAVRILSWTEFEEERNIRPSRAQIE